jgi:3-oxoadipate CoA-transferase alpha subunit
VGEVVDTGSLDPEIVVTPGIFVDRVVRVATRHYTVEGAR